MSEISEQDLREAKDLSKWIAENCIGHSSEMSCATWRSTMAIEKIAQVLAAVRAPQQGEKAEAQIEEAVTTEWKRIKPSMAAQEARSKAYLVLWDDLNIPDYVVYMMDIAAQFAIQRTEARLKECVDALQVIANDGLTSPYIKEIARTALENVRKK